MQVSGLSRRVHASPVLREAFEQLAFKDPTLASDQRMLTERVDTRWDTDHDCLDSHIHFKVQTQLMTANPKYKLKGYALNDAQWALADEMVTVLEVNRMHLIYMRLSIILTTLINRYSKSVPNVFHLLRSPFCTRHSQSSPPCDPSLRLCATTQSI